MDLTDRNAKPSRDGLEDHQHWVWMWDEPQPQPRPLAQVDNLTATVDPSVNLSTSSGHWEIVGTGAVL